MAEIGYDRLTIDAVAARARAGKATVYRRWANKVDLVVEAFSEEMFGGLKVPDHGDLRSDLLDMTRQIWGATGPVSRTAVMAGLMSAQMASPELRESMQAACLAPQKVLVEIVARAASRGEIAVPPRPEMVAWVVPSMCMFHMVRTGGVPGPEFFEDVIDHVVLPALRASGSAKERRR